MTKTQAPPSPEDKKALNARRQRTYQEKMRKTHKRLQVWIPIEQERAFLDMTAKFLKKRAAKA